MSLNPHLFHRLIALAFGIVALLLTGASWGEEPLQSGMTSVNGPEWVSAPVTPASWDGDIRDLPPVKPWKPGDPIKEVPRRFYPDPAQVLAAAPFWLDADPDPLVAKQRLYDEQCKQEGESVVAVKAPIVNVAGQGYTGVAPADPVGDVGPNHYVQAINGYYGAVVQVYDKTGATIGGAFSMLSLGGTGSCSSTAGDPIVLYDRIADRWFLLEFSNSGNGLCIHVSKTANPVSGGWWTYTFDQPTFPDYPHCAVWWDGYYCTANEGNTDRPVYVFDRANMLTGSAATQQTFKVSLLSGYGFQALTPVTFTGSASPPAGAEFIAVRHNDDEAHAGAAADPTKDFIDVFSVKVNWTAPASSTITTLPRINIAEFNSYFRNYSTYATVPQPGSTKKLDPIREVILNRANYRNFGTHESVVGDFATNIDPARTGTTVNAGIRWFELRRTPPGSGSWALYQEGTYGPGATTTHHLEGSIAQNKAGDLGMGFNVTQTSTPNIFASIKYSGRYSTDTTGVMTLGENDIVAGTAVETSGRWGDYAAISVDPADDCTFWFTSMYRPAGGWATQVASFKFLPAAPAAPTFTGISSNGLIVNWATSGGAKTYDVYRIAGNSCTGAIKINASPVSGLAYSDSGLSPATQYSYFIVGSSECGSSGNGTCNTVTTSAASAPLRVPYSITPTKATTTSHGTDMSVSWDVANCPSTNYHIVYGRGENVASLSTGSPTLDGGKCYMGTTGTYNWTSVPDPSAFTSRYLWFLVVGDNGSTTESSWGLTSGAAERGGATASNQCSCTAKNTSGACGTN